MNPRTALPLILLLLFASACLNSPTPIASSAVVEAQEFNVENIDTALGVEVTVVEEQPTASPMPESQVNEVVESAPEKNMVAATATPLSIEIEEEKLEEVTEGETFTPEPVANPVTMGPALDDFPTGFNPLTGLPVDNPDLLNLPAVLVSITNFPVSARPQAGLSFASQVYEIFIGYGQTRFLTVFYGHYPDLTENQAVDTSIPNVVGPVRSGRLAYGPLQSRLPGSCLVYASAASNVREAVPACQFIYGSDESDINSAFLDITALQSVAEKNLDPNRSYNYSGNQFSTNIPSGDVAAELVHVFYNYYNQTEWVYDQAAGGYLRFNDIADGSGKFYASTDRLNDEQLVYQNVIVLYAEHIAQSPTLIDINLDYTTGRAVIFRDGQAYDVFWTTSNTEYEKETGLLRPVRFVDAEGNAFPLSPGQTWVHMVSMSTEVWEFSPGEWRVRFYAPVEQ